MSTKEKTVASRLSREDGTNITYNGLLERPGPLSNKKKKYTRDIFTLALAFGYDMDIRTPIEIKDNFANKENFGETLPSLINALAITKSGEGIDILGENPSDIYRVAEEYANGGLELLNSEYLNGADEFIEKLRIKILDLNKDDRILKKLEELDL